jgi:hypothetical protein
LEYRPPVTGQRRTLVEQYYHTLDWTRDSAARKLLKVADAIVADLDALMLISASAEYATAERSKLLSALSSDGYTYDDGQFVPKGSATRFPSIQASERLDAPELHRQLERIRVSIDSDPALALGTAKELVETACKTILEEHRVSADAEWDIGKLVKQTRATLQLLPSDIPDGAKGAEAIRRLLSNLGALVQGLGELRNLYGTGHGRAARRRGIEPRHARLAAGAATALVTFLLETHWDRTA